MHLTLVEYGKLTALTLPAKVNGQYWMERPGPMGGREKVLSVEAVDGRWTVRSGRNTVFETEPGAEYREHTLNGDDCVQVLFRNTGERATLLAEPVIPSELVFRKLQIPHRATVRIGPQDGDDIVLDGRFPVRVQIDYHDEQYRLQNTAPQSGVYVNGVRKDSTELFPGDRVYLAGVHLIVGKKFLALDHGSRVKAVNRQLLTPYPVQRGTAVPAEEYFDDPSSDNVFYRSPRFKRDIHRRSLNLDPPPNRQAGSETPLILTLGPSMTMGMAAMFTAMFTVTNAMASGRSISSVAPTLVMSCSMLLGCLMWPILTKRFERRNNAKKEKIRQRKYYDYLEKMKTGLAEEAAHQREILHENVVSTADCVRRIELRERNLWERMPGHNDFLTVRLGIGDLPLDINFQAPKESFTVEEDELRDAMHLLAAAPRIVSQVPVPLSLTEDHVVGVTGPRESCREFARNLIFQLAALHSYTDLKMVFLYDGEETDEWDFVRWIPHTWNDEQTFRFIAADMDDLKELSAHLERLLSARAEQKSAVAGPPHYVIFSMSRTLAKRAEMLNQVLQSEQYLGFSAILLYDELKNLPKECARVVELGGETARLYDRDDITGQQQLFAADPPMEQSAHKVALALANIKLDQAEKAFLMPNMLTFLEMLGADRIEHLNPLERWQQNNPVHTLQAPVGVLSSGDIFYLDLHEKYHGPHGLIAGMTGSGKSEFIMTFILSLALNYHPHEVAFILIDYKGGGMANAFTDLPHLAGVITNLDGAAVNRSLVSIQSELQRRQAIFSETSKAVGVSNIDIYKYQKLYRDGRVGEPLQHLFIISDEFAELKTQQPEFMKQLVSAARIGRSLGIHLILATQRPSGVVDDQIWSNARFRVCLKVQDTSDSKDVIKRPDAAALSVTGRFYVQVGSDEVFELGQSAWAGAPYDPDGDSRTDEDDVMFIDKLGRVIKEMRPPRQAVAVREPPKQLDEITGYLKTLAREEGIRIRPLWLEPLPTMLLLDRLEEKYDYRVEPLVLKPVIGEYDDPARQSQQLMTLPLGTGGHILLYGVAGSGKTTFLSSLVYSTIRHHSADEVNFYILDFGAETLRCFQGAPQVGDVIFSSQEEKVDNLFRILHGELAERKKRFVDYGGDYLSYCKAVGPIPRIVVIIHNYSAFHELFEQKATEDLPGLTREGLKYGMVFLLSCTGVGDVRYRMQQNFAQIYSLQLNDPSDYRTVFPAGERIQPAAHRGRGLLYNDGLYEFQTACAAQPDELFPFLAGFSRKARDGWKGSAARPVPVLPERCDIAFLRPHILREGTGIPVGVDRYSLEVVQQPFAGYLNLVSWSSADGQPFLQAIAELYAAKGTDVAVLDPTESFPERCAYPCARGAGAKQAAADFYQLVLERNNSYKTHVKEGKAPPVFREKVVVIHDLNALIAALDSEAKQSFAHTLLYGEARYAVRVILSALNLSAIAREEWFVKHLSLDSFVWVGSGISEQFALRVNGKAAVLRQPLPDDFGYIVDKSRPRLLKLAMPDGTAQP